MTGTERAPTDPPADGDAVEPLKEVSDLHRMAAPQNFEVELTETIRKRSGGRFFGPKSIGDRIPFIGLAIAAIVIGVIVFLLMRSSDTGTLRYENQPDKPDVHPEASEQMPSPYRR